MSWTHEQVIALAPDASAAKNAQGLATPRKWQLLGHMSSVLWGECKGSGKEPYQVLVDSTGPTLHCTCPSRKRPCKHALGLFLLFASQPDALSASEPPPWVTDWMERRAARDERQRKKQETKTTAIASDDEQQQQRTQAQEKRAGEREAKVTAGMDELELWLHDLMRQGIADVLNNPARFWETTAARMVDAQVPGAARLIHEIAALPIAAPDRAVKILHLLARLHLLVEGYKRIDTLPPALQADVRQMAGWTQNQEELLRHEGVRDRWCVIGQYSQDDTITSIGVAQRLRMQRTWLWGIQSRQSALILDFAHGKQPLDTSLIPGSCVDAELVYYPSNVPLRALVKSRSGAVSCNVFQSADTPNAHNTHPQPAAGYATIAEAITAYAGTLARFPWLEQFPFVLQAVIPVQSHDTWIVRDLSGHMVPLSPRFQHLWKMLAVSGGHPIALAGEWDGESLLPLGAWSAGRFVGMTLSLH